MARGNSSLLDKLIGLASKLPWWAALVFAGAAYVWLRGAVGHDVMAVAGSGKIGEIADRHSLQSWAVFGQFLLPAVFLLVAAMSVYGRFRHGSAFGQTVLGPARGALSDMTWRQFEVVLAKGFRRKGYTVAQTVGGGALGETDLVLIKDGQTYLVFSKQWRAIKVGERSVRELHKDMVARGAAGGFAVTTGVFTDNACAFAADHHIELLDGRGLQTMIGGIRAPGRFFRDPLSVMTMGAPFCPECQSRMVIRKARQGDHAGKKTWRCSRYPDCMGTRPV